MWYDPSFVANIFEFAHLVDSDDTRITYDSKKEDAFIVHSRSEQVKFTRTPEGFYAYQPSKAYLKQIAELKSPVKGGGERVMATVALNTEGYSKREIKHTHEARQLLHTVGRPSIADFKQAIRSNKFTNCKVTLDNMRVMEGLFGPDAASLK